VENDFENAKKLVEAAIRKIGLDPATCRASSASAGQSAWTLKRGSASVLVAVTKREDEGVSYLRVASPVVTLPADPARHEALFRKLLELNAAGLANAAFGLMGDRVVVVSERPVAGLDEGEPAPGRVALQAAACGVAVLVTGAPLLGDLDALLHGEVFALVPLVSDVADAIVLVLLAPLLQTTVALRGGVLRWPWAMLTLNNVLWLVFDAAYGFGGVWHIDSDRRRLVMEALRTLATAYTFSAGLAQRWAVAPAPPLERQPAS